MKFAVFTPGCPPDATIDWPTRGEGRWSLNWIRILREEGHEVYQIHDQSVRGPHTPVCDWYLNAPWFQMQACHLQEVPNKNHCHLHYGKLTPDCELFRIVEQRWPQVSCIQDGSCKIVFGYTHNLHQSLPYWNIEKGRQYKLGNMPIPFSKSMCSDPISNPFMRKGIAWMAKEIFHPEYLRTRPNIPSIGEEFLKALVKLSAKTDFTLYYMEDSRIPPTPLAAELLSKLHVVKLNLMPFTGVLQLMSQIKINLAVAGMAACTLDSLFRRAVPLAHAGGFMTKTLEQVRPDILLPDQTDNPRVEQIYPVLERLWFDYPFFRHAEECFQSDFSDHHKDTALRHFGRFLESI